MTLVLHIGPEDWGQCRFSVSAPQETTAALRFVRRVRDGELTPQRPWERYAVERAAALPLDPLLDLLPPRSFSPDVLHPPPLGPVDDMETGLAWLANVDAAVFAEQAARCRTAQGLPPVDTPARTQQDQAMEALALGWEALVRPSWPRLRDLLDADIAVRAAHLAAGGVAAVLADLHPLVVLVGSSILVGIDHQGEVDLGGRGLSLLPSAWPSSIGAGWEPPWPPTVTYPARGAGADPAPVQAGLGKLLGRTRGALLAALERPATTSGLAARCSVPLSTVSDHLTVLRAAGLVATARTGHALSHRRTDLGDALVHAGGPR